MRAWWIIPGVMEGFVWFGGFNRSSQHPGYGGVDGTASGMDGDADGSAGDEVSGEDHRSVGRYSADSGSRSVRVCPARTREPQWVFRPRPSDRGTKPRALQSPKSGDTTLSVPLFAALRLL